MMFCFFSSRRRHTSSYGDWSSDVCSSDLLEELPESVAASAVELAAKTLGGVENRRALLFGAGKMSELAARELRARGAEVVISSRTLESAQELADRVGGTAAPFDAVAVELTE